ncbi:MAG: FG-GAP-like repeat-containing protein [bacterium]
MVGRKRCSYFVFYSFAVFLLVQIPNISIAQTGNTVNRRRGLIDGNQVQTLFCNHGEIGSYPDEPTMCWLSDTHHYIDGITLMVSVATTDNNGNRIHPLETQYREFVDTSPEGTPWGFEPLPGYYNPYQDNIALSDRPSTWSAYWPDKMNDLNDPGWPGQWNSFFGKGLTNPFIDLETYYVMDDDPDEEWDFYPDENDHSRRGVGLEVSVRALQSSYPLFEDVVFWIYDIKNESTHDYDRAYVGFFIDWGIGGVGDEDSDYVEFDKDQNIVYAYDYDGYGYPNSWCPVGYAGLAFIDTPNQNQMTGVKIFSVHECELINDELIWKIFLEPLPPKNVYQKNHPATIISSGPFSINAGETVRFSTALLFGNDENDLITNKQNAQHFYNAGFELPDSLSVLSALCTADRNFGAPPLEVQFTDYSTTDRVNDIVSWYWNFGDNSTSTLQNPKHTYSKEGIYDVTLIVIDQNAKVSTIVKKAFVIVDQFSQVLDGSIVQDSIPNSYRACWGDYNNNGYQDLFIARGSFNEVGIKPNQYNSLYQNSGDNSFTSINSGDIVNKLEKSSNACWGDFNNDGYLDLFVTNGNDDSEENNCLFKNNGDGTFTKITEGAIVNDGGKSFAGAWADYNLDGFIDLYVANLGINFLYRNNGDGTFIKINEGDIVNDEVSSNACCWGDYNNDGDPDLCVANYGDNNLYKNNGDGTFVKISGQNIETDGSNSQGCSWADYNNDGFLDLFIANGHSVYGENNILYLNNGDATFSEVNEGEIANDDNNSVNVCWEDYDNDGDLDLLVINSINITYKPNYFEENCVYLNDGQGNFTKIPKGLSLTNTPYKMNMGAAWSDYNNDGFSDIIVTRIKNNSLYSNRGNQNHWINIKCMGTSSNTAAIGARVQLKSTINGNSVWQMRDIYGQNGNSLNARFGLGDASIIDSIEIKWPSGLVETYVNIDVNQFARATEGVGWEGSVGISNQNESTPTYYSLSQNYPNPFNPLTAIHYQLPVGGNVKLQVFDLTGRLIQILVNEKKPAGEYIITWNAQNVSSGIYFYRIQTEGFTSVKKCVKLK